jgi:hypothetical protein
LKEIAALLAALLLATCAAPPATSPATSPQAAAAEVTPLDVIRGKRNLELVTTILVGTWDTIPQKPGFGDSTPMRLRVAWLWPERADGNWLYLEYVNPADEKQVLRQRILRFVREGAAIHALMYRLPGDPLAYAGEWRKARPFESVTPDSLREAEGCRSEWVLQFETYFAAGTEGNACRGDRPEVRNEHSEFSLGPGALRTWITGLDASGSQVEGLSGPSEFRKTSGKSI